MNIKEVIKELKKLDRYENILCGDGGSHIDSWFNIDNLNGKWVEYSDIEKIIGRLEDE